MVAGIGAGLGWARIWQHDCRIKGETPNMASINSLNELLVEQLKDLYDAEKRLTKAIPKMARKATNEDLRSALEDHLQETEQQLGRLEEAFAHLDEKVKGKPCAGMRGIIEEGDEHVGEDYDDDDLRDAVIIGAAQRVEHYEIAAYGTAIAHAKLLGHNEIVQLLVVSMNEEKAADEKLTEIAEGVVNLDAAADDDEEEETRRASTTSQRAMAMSRATGSRGRATGKAKGKGGTRARR
jgi:ferritin-like metal-binding protein YciE